MSHAHAHVAFDALEFETRLVCGPFAIAWLTSRFVGDVSQYDRVQVLSRWVLVRELTLIGPVFVVYSFFVTVA